MLFLSCADEVEKVARLNNDVAKITLAKEVTFAATINIAKSIIVTGLNLKMPDLRYGIFNTQAYGNAIVELLFYTHGVLGDDRVAAPCRKRLIALAQFKIGRGGFT